MSIDDRLYNVVRQAIPDPSVRIDDELSPERCRLWDSVVTINLMFLIEEEFGVQFASNSFLDFPNVGAIKAYLHEAAA